MTAHTKVELLLEAQLSATAKYFWCTCLLAPGIGAHHNTALTAKTSTHKKVLTQNNLEA